MYTCILGPHILIPVNVSVPMNLTRHVEQLSKHFFFGIHI